MKIPTDLGERQRFYADLLGKCLASRSSRFDFYSMLRSYLLFGTADQTNAPYNKVFSTVDTLTSFIYSPEACHFSLVLGTTTTELDIAMAQPLAKEIGEQFRMSRTNLHFGLGLLWSLVFGCMLLKYTWNKKSKSVRSYLVEPHQFGVLREDVLDLSDQEAFCMCYSTTKTQLETWLEGNPRKAQILDGVNAAPPGDQNTLSAGLQRLIIGGSVVGGVPGSLTTTSGSSEVTLNKPGVDYNYAPAVAADMVDMVELYVWDDAIDDYQLVTMANPNVIVFDRPQSQVGIKGRPHFSVIRPEMNTYDYFWADSFVARLCGLQDWRTQRVAEIRTILAKQADPPGSISGATGIQEEKYLALRKAGGIANLGQTGKYEKYSPDMPADLFLELSQIDAMFDDTAGIGHVLQGKGEPGVRSRGQADLMARLGSARPKKRAIVAEDCLQDCAEVIMANIQENSAQRFTVSIGGKPETYIANQFTKDYEVKVDSHSASPIFVEDRKKDAEEMLKAGVIDGETFLEMFDPPNVQALKVKFKAIQAKREEEKKLELAAEAKKSAK